MLSKILNAVLGQLAVQMLFFSIDDTMVEKESERSEPHSKFFDYAAHNGSNHLNGHCMVSILPSFPVLADGSISGVCLVWLLALGQRADKIYLCHAPQKRK